MCSFKLRRKKITSKNFKGIRVYRKINGRYRQIKNNSVNGRFKNLRVDLFDGNGNKISKKYTRIKRNEFKDLQKIDFIKINENLYKKDFKFMEFFETEKENIIRTTRKIKSNELPELQEFKTGTYSYSDKSGSNKTDLIINIGDGIYNSSEYFLAIINKFLLINNLKPDSIVIGFKTVNEDFNTLSAAYSPYIEKHKETLLFWIDDLKQRIIEYISSGVSGNDTEYETTLFNIIVKI